jgi:hypothetical protein
VKESGVHFYLKHVVSEKFKSLIETFETTNKKGGSIPPYLASPSLGMTRTTPSIHPPTIHTPAGSNHLHHADTDATLPSTFRHASAVLTVVCVFLKIHSSAKCRNITWSANFST